MKALRAGKHLYSQKPVGLTVDQVNEQIAAAQTAGVKFAASPIHPLRPDIIDVKEMIERGTIGKVTMVRAHAAHGGPEHFQYRAADCGWFFSAWRRRALRYGSPWTYHGSRCYGPG